MSYSTSEDALDRSPSFLFRRWTRKPSFRDPSGRTRGARKHDSASPSLASVRNPSLLGADVNHLWPRSATWGGHQTSTGDVRACRIVAPRRNIHVAVAASPRPVRGRFPRGAPLRRPARPSRSSRSRGRRSRPASPSWTCPPSPRVFPRLAKASRRNPAPRPSRPSRRGRPVSRPDAPRSSSSRDTSRPRRVGTCETFDVALAVAASERGRRPPCDAAKISRNGRRLAPAARRRKRKPERPSPRRGFDAASARQVDQRAARQVRLRSTTPGEARGARSQREPHQVVVAAVIRDRVDAPASPIVRLESRRALVRVCGHGAPRRAADRFAVGLQARRVRSSVQGLAERRLCGTRPIG